MTEFVGPCRGRLLVGRWRVPPREDWVVKALYGKLEKDEGRLEQQLIRLPGEYKLAWLSPMARFKEAARLTSQALDIERRRVTKEDERILQFPTFEAINPRQPNLQASEPRQD